MQALNKKPNKIEYTVNTKQAEWFFYNLMKSCACELQEAFDLYKDECFFLEIQREIDAEIQRVIDQEYFALIEWYRQNRFYGLPERHHNLHDRYFHAECKDDIYYGEKTALSRHLFGLLMNFFDDYFPELDDMFPGIKHRIENGTL